MFNIFNKQRFNVLTYTYFIPAPPIRQSGYREKQFDQLMENFLANGFDVLDIKTQSISHTNSAGMWVICLLRPKNKAAANFNLDSLQEKVANNNSQGSNAKNTIDGFYYIHEENNFSNNPDDEKDFEYYDQNKTYKK